MDGSFLCFYIVLSVPGQEVKCSKKAVRVFQTVTLFIKLLPLPQAGMPPKTL